MGKRSRNFKLTNNKKKEKHVPKEKYDYSKYKGRVVGHLQDGYPIFGSESSLVKPLTNKSIAPFELYDKIEIEYVKRGMLIFKKYMGNTGGNTDISMW